MNSKPPLSVLAACVVTLGLSVAATAQESPSRSITKITGDLYRGTQNAHHTAFLVTPEGIILTDPIGVEFASWLKTELAQRFDVPVKYVLYSHHHQDHASGGAAFEDTAEFIGHENMVKDLTAEKGNDAYANVRAPDRTYSDTLTIELGGKSVQMIHALPSHSDDSSIIYFPEERAVFAVDFVNVRRLPYRTMGNGPIQSWIEANKDLQKRVDYDIMAPGHGPVGKKSDIEASTRYLEELLAAVSKGLAAGQSLEQLKESVLMKDYSAWGQYDAWRAENVEAAYRSLRGDR
jgi:glyoxylase-like metal-dependent hydrolase (beta-lactamase superfamily II)